MDNKKMNTGQIRAIRGSVVDAFFPQFLPKINYQLKSHEAIIEVTLHLDATTVRGIALTPTQGLKRGDEIIDMGHPLQVPVGSGLLGRMFNVFYSNIYRETYAEFLKIDFSRVPFTSDCNLFIEMGKLGKELTALHLLKSSEHDSPIAKYQGSGDNDRIEKVIHKEDEQRIYINKEKYFEGVTPEVWNYHIGGYQVLHKYLKDRKDRMMDDAPRYCRIVTALYKTIEIQKQIDNIYPEIEKNFVRF